MEKNPLFPKGAIENFLEKIDCFMTNIGIDVSKFFPDHLCYRVETEQQYLELCSKLNTEGKLLAESKVNGRLISTFKMNHLASFQGKEISVIEIPSPKKNNKCKAGFEHIEFVINCSLSEFVSQYPQVNFDLKNWDKNVNADVRVKNEDETISVKFHCQSLEDVIDREIKNRNP